MVGNNKLSFYFSSFSLSLSALTLSTPSLTLPEKVRGATPLATPLCPEFHYIKQIGVLVIIGSPESFAMDKLGKCSNPTQKNDDEQVNYYSILPSPLLDMTLGVRLLSFQVRGPSQYPITRNLGKPRIEKCVDGVLPNTFNL